MTVRKLVVVGGVAGGASCAARARRLSEDAEIVLVERGPFISFANCGLPYHIGGEIPDRGKLILRTPEELNRQFRLDVRVRTEAVSIDREAATVRLRNLATGEETDESYDALVLSTGAAPLRPPIPGIDQPGIFSLRNIPDMDAIGAWMDETEARQAVVVGGGYIGLEMAEQLHHRDLRVSVAEALPQIMAPLDPEMAAILEGELRQRGIDIHLGSKVVGFDGPEEGKGAPTVVLENGTRLPADIVVLGLGVRPDVPLAREAGIELGERGGIRVDEYNRTSDPRIYAVGDAVEVRDGVTGEWCLVPLAGPANRQGRNVADTIFLHPTAYRGTFGTAGVRLFQYVAACTGANEKRLRAAGIPHKAIHLHPGNHVGYYPGATPIAMKLLFSPEDGRVLGAQAVGQEGAERRIDVIATAIMAGMTVDELAHLELAYAPPFGAAKDPVNMAGMAAQNILRGLTDVVHWDEVELLDPEKDFLLDVRNEGELTVGRIPGAVHIPFPELRERLDELPRDKRIVAHCATGPRSYFVTRILNQNGFRSANLSGSYVTWSKAPKKVPAPSP